MTAASNEHLSGLGRRGEAFWLPYGGWGNGLTAEAWVPVAEVLGDRAELYVYPAQQHLFTDRSLPSYDAESAAKVTERVLGFLDRV